MKSWLPVLQLLLLTFTAQVWAQADRVVDIPTRPGVTQRFVYLAAENPKAAVILFPGGHGGLQIQPNASFTWGETISWCGRVSCLRAMDCPSLFLTHHLIVSLLPFSAASAKGRSMLRMRRPSLPGSSSRPMFLCGWLEQAWEHCPLPLLLPRPVHATQDPMAWC